MVNRNFSASGLGADTKIVIAIAAINLLFIVCQALCSGPFKHYQILPSQQLYEVMDIIVILKMKKQKLKKGKQLTQRHSCLVSALEFRVLNKAHFLNHCASGFLIISVTIVTY